MSHVHVGKSLSSLGICDLLSSGYIRESQKRFGSDLFSMIPSDIVSIVAGYANHYDEWSRDLSTPDCDITHSKWDNDTAKFTARNLHTLFGSEVIESGSFTWNIKIQKMCRRSNTSPPFFGLIEDDAVLISKHRRNAFWCDNKQRGYIWCGGPDHSKYGGDDDPEVYGIKCASDGDELTMTLDLEERTIGMAVNGVDQGVAWQNVRPARYRGFPFKSSFRLKA